MNKFWWIFGTGLGTLLILVYFSFNPAAYSFFPKCPMFMLFNINCPGCGAQRAVHALLHGEIYSAIHFNLLLVLSIPLLAGYGGIKFWKSISPKYKEPGFLQTTALPKLAALVVLLFWILRNINVYPFSFLAA